MEESINEQDINVKEVLNEIIDQIIFNEHEKGPVAEFKELSGIEVPQNNDVFIGSNITGNDPGKRSVIVNENVESNQENFESKHHETKNNQFHIHKEKHSNGGEIKGDKSIQERWLRYFCYPFGTLCLGESDKTIFHVLKYQLFRGGNYGMGAWKVGRVSSDVILANLS